MLSLRFAPPQVLVRFEQSFLFVVVDDFSTDVDCEVLAEYPSEIVFEPRLCVAVRKLECEVHRVGDDDFVRAELRDVGVVDVPWRPLFFEDRGCHEGSDARCFCVFHPLVTGLEFCVRRVHCFCLFMVFG